MILQYIIAISSNNLLWHSIWHKNGQLHSRKTCVIGPYDSRRNRPCQSTKLHNNNEILE